MNHVEDILKRSIEIHLKKRADYTSRPNENPFENFERSNKVASWFPEKYKSFGVLIGTKLARLGSLLSSGRTPNNESIDDSFLDLVTYCALAYGYYKDKQGEPSPPKDNPCLHNFVDERTNRCINCSYVVSEMALANNYKFSDKPNILIRRA